MRVGNNTIQRKNTQTAIVLDCPSRALLLLRSFLQDSPAHMRDTATDNICHPLCAIKYKELLSYLNYFVLMSKKKRPLKLNSHFEYECVVCYSCEKNCCVEGSIATCFIQ